MAVRMVIVLILAGWGPLTWSSPACAQNQASAAGAKDTADSSVPNGTVPLGSSQDRGVTGFMAGGQAGQFDVPTSWPDALVQWSVLFSGQGEHAGGVLGNGKGYTDSDGRLPLKFSLPSVDEPATLAILANLHNSPAQAMPAMQLVVLPESPSANLVGELGPGSVGYAGYGGMVDALHGSGVACENISSSQARSSFEGAVVVLDAMDSVTALRISRWMESYPAGVCFIIARDARTQALLSPVLESFELDIDRQPSKFIAESDNPAWAGLDVEWFTWPSLTAGVPDASDGDDDPAYDPVIGTANIQRLSGAVALTRLQVVAGYVDIEGTVYPLVTELRDVFGHRWLVWTIPQRWNADDLRWSMILRNSLRWALARTVVGSPRRSGDAE